MANINVSLYSLLSSKPDKFCLSNVDLNENVANFKDLIAKRCNLNVETLNCVHRGIILEDEKQLQLSGIQSGTIIHCISKNDSKAPSITPLNLIEVQNLLVSLRSATSNSGFRSFIKKMRSVDQFESITAEYPAIANDPAAIAFLQEPDFITTLLNVQIFSRIVEERPNVGRGLQILCNLMAKEVPSPRRSHHVSYSMDALSDEEMDVEQNESAPAAPIASRGSDFQAITPAQLTAALANAAGGSSWRGSSSRTPLSGLTPPSSALTPLNTPAPPSGGSGAATGGGTSPGGQITTEMFSQALQNALAASATRSSSGSVSSAPPPAAPSTNSSSIPLPNVEESLQLMREMGITDSGMSLQALQATDGDVQAAVNLIFAQWMADD